MIIVNDVLETEHFFRDKGEFLRYTIKVSDLRTLNIPIEIIDNPYIVNFICRKVLKYHSICYSNLWLFPFTDADKQEAADHLSLITAI